MWRYVDNDTNLARTGSCLSSLSSWWSNRNRHILWRNGNAVVVGWMVSLQKIHPPPNPRTCERDLLWKLSLPMTLSMLRWYHAGYPVGPKTNSKCRIYKRHTEDMMWRWRQSLEHCGYKPGNAKNGWQPPGAAERHGMKGHLVLPTLWFWTSSLQNYERINFFFLLFIFYWRMIALQNFAVFCQTSTWISHRYTYIPSLLNLSPTSLPSPPL